MALSSDLDNANNPLSARLRGILLGTVIMIAVPGALVSALAIPLLYGLVAASCVAATLRYSPLRAPWRRYGETGPWIAAFLLYAVLSATWSAEPLTSLKGTGFAVLVAVATCLIVNLVMTEHRSNILHMARGLWIGFLVGLIYFLADIAAHQGIKLWVLSALRIEPGNLKELIADPPLTLTRNAAPISLFLFPALMAVAGGMAKPWSILAGSAIIAAAFAAVLLWYHETSKLAFIVGSAAYLLARLLPRLNARLFLVSWVVACLVMLPASMIAYRLDLHHAHWLQASARDRIAIWTNTAQRTLRSPIVGVGANMTRVISKQDVATSTGRPVGRFEPRLTTHAHSVYLQTWFELGIVGSVLLTLVGLAALRRINELARNLQPYAYATFASAAIMAGSSYGMWHAWFVAMFGFAAAMFALGIRAMDVDGSAPADRKFTAQAERHLSPVRARAAVPAAPARGPARRTPA